MPDGDSSDGDSSEGHTSGHDTSEAVREPLLLAPQLDAAARARTYVRGGLLGWGFEELLDPVLLLTSEIVSNALLHAGTRMRVWVHRDSPGVRVEVADGSPVPPVRRRRSSSATTGRGVQLLDSLADEWGWTPEEDGKLVWFRVLSADAWVAAFDVDLISEAVLPEAVLPQAKL